MYVWCIGEYVCAYSGQVYMCRVDRLRVYGG